MDMPLGWLLAATVCGTVSLLVVFGWFAAQLLDWLSCRRSVVVTGEVFCEPSDCGEYLSAQSPPWIEHPTALTLEETTRYFGVASAEIIDWCSRGAPVRYLADDGRGRSDWDRSFFNVHDLETWRQGDTAALEAKRAELLAQDQA